MNTLDLQRRFFAEEIEAACRLRSTALVEAFAAVPRERFLPTGPWMVLSEADLGAVAVVVGGTKSAPATKAGAPRMQATPDADPRRVYHNIAVAIDPSRSLFNGQPGTLAAWIDALDLTRGARLLHVGCGLGYYTAVMAHCVGEHGRVVAFEVDEALAEGAARNLASMPWVEVRQGDASGALDGPFDAMVINAGVTHPLDGWLDALAAGGRLLLPLTSEMPVMGATLGKGLVVLAMRRSEAEYSARVLSFVAIYSAVGIRSPDLNDRVAKALMAGPMQWQKLERLRRDPHEAGPGCWLHLPNCCLALAAAT